MLHALKNTISVYRHSEPIQEINILLDTLMPQNCGRIPCINSLGMSTELSCQSHHNERTNLRRREM